MLLYFAYGSNLCVARLEGRVRSCDLQGVARLDGYRMEFNKRGRDGSGKANLVPDSLGMVWGVVYELETGVWPVLDGFEGGYERVCVEVELPTSSGTQVQSYRSSRLCAEPPYAWYKEHVLEGARSHGLPEHWLRWLEGVEARPGPSCEI